jgi:hypothetical protein
VTVPSSSLADVLAELPLPWTAVVDEPCVRIIAANDATVLACSPDEAPIVCFIASRISADAQGVEGSSTPDPAAPFHETVAALAALLAVPGDFTTDGDFVDALIVAAEAVIAAATSTKMTA